MNDLTEQDLAALDPAGYLQDKYDEAMSRIKELEAAQDTINPIVVHKQAQRIEKLEAENSKLRKQLHDALVHGKHPAEDSDE